MDLVVIRRLLAAVLLFGMTGLLVELVLLDHYEDFNQQIPLLVLAAGIGAIVTNLAVAGRATYRALQVVMAAFVLAGLAGMYLHFAGSREFQLEMDPQMGGTELVWRVLRAKSPPTLSPGTMVQMGILGLGYAYLRRTR